MAADGSGFAVVTTDRPNVIPPASVVCNAYSFSLNAGNAASYFVNTHAPVWTSALTGCTGVMSVAISGDGSRIAAVANFPKTGGTKGKVYFFDTQSSVPLWVGDTDSGPNSVSMDADGKFVAVADGFGPPVGKFYLFDRTAPPSRCRPSRIPSRGRFSCQRTGRLLRPALTTARFIALQPRQRRCRRRRPTYAS